MTGAPAWTLPPGVRSSSLPARVLWSVARVAGTVVLTFLGLLLVTFLIGRVVPIDPVLAAVGDRAPVEVYERVKQELGLDLPLWQQFWIYLRKVLTGDFGRSVLTANPVLADIRRVFPATLELATVATIIGVALGVPLGVVAAVKRGRARTLSYVAMATVAAALLAVAALDQGGARTDEERAQAIAETIQCPACSGQSVAGSNASSAQAIRAEIAERVADGETDDEIRAYFASRYGEQILLTPPSSGAGAVVWVAPVVALAVASLALVLAFRRWQRWE